MHRRLARTTLIVLLTLPIIPYLWVRALMSGGFCYANSSFSWTRNSFLSSKCSIKMVCSWRFAFSNSAISGEINVSLKNSSPAVLVMLIACSSQRWERYHHRLLSKTHLVWEHSWNWWSYLIFYRVVLHCLRNFQYQKTRIQWRIQWIIFEYIRSFV